MQLNLVTSRAAKGCAESWTEGYAKGRVEGQIDDRRNLLADMSVAPEESVVEVLDTLEGSWRGTGQIPSIKETVEVAAGARPWCALLTG